jgi:hypothetical protein
LSAWVVAETQLGTETPSAEALSTEKVLNAFAQDHDGSKMSTSDMVRCQQKKQTAKRPRRKEKGHCRRKRRKSNINHEGSIH